MNVHPIELYLGFWFPLGINNVLVLGKKLLEFSRTVETRDDYRGSSSNPYRKGDSIFWEFYVSVADGDSSNYQIKVHLRWYGTGFLICRSIFSVRQDNKEIQEITDVPASVVRKAYSVLEQYLTDIFLECALPHQMNYAKNILFGEALSSALNNYNLDDVDFLPKDLQAKLMDIRTGKTLGASNEEVAKGIIFLLTRTLAFTSLNDVNLSDFDKDFQFDDLREKLLKDVSYVKGRAKSAYDFKFNYEANKYSEKRGSIAITQDMASDDLVAYLLGINGVLQFCSMLSYELVKLRESISKARIFLLKFSGEAEIISDFVEILEAKLPLYKELVEFIKLDALRFLQRLYQSREVSSKLGEFSKTDTYIDSYFTKLEDYIFTLERISHGLTEEIFALNEFLTINTQQRQTELAQESKAAATRTLDTQTTLTEFQRAAVLKGRKTKWLSAFTIAAAIAAGTGLFEILSTFLWQIFVKSRPFIISVLGGDASNVHAPEMPQAFGGFIKISGGLFIAIVIGKFIIYLEGKIPDIIQYSFNLDNIDISYAAFKDFLGSKSVKTLRETEDSFQITWTKKITIWLKLNEGDKVPSTGRLERIYSSVIDKIERWLHPVKQVKRQAVCTLNCDIQIYEGDIRAVNLQSLTISVERNQREVTEAYIYPIHLEASEILCALLENRKSMRQFILEVTKAEAFDEFRRSSETINSVIEKNIAA